MPLITVDTNVALPPDTAAKCAKALSESLAAALGKPEAYVAVRLNPGACVLFGGTADPAAICAVSSIGAIDVDHNTAVSAAVADTLGQAGIDSARIYITFTDVERANWGWKGKTFANQ